MSTVRKRAGSLYRKAKKAIRPRGKKQPAKKPDVSVVIPLYNAMPYFERTAASLLEQTLSQERFEVIIVDDGSTDKSKRYAKRLARKHSGLFHYHRIPASGGPSRPRNIGMQEARGKYVFFLDADDYLGSEALERMLAHAKEWKSDILVPKQVGENGRKAPSSMFRVSLPHANIWKSRVFNTLSPTKLFKRTFLMENGLAFPEDLRVHEDGVFTARAYFCASIVSVASDYDYCHIVLRDESTNLTTGDNLGYDADMRAARAMLSSMEEHMPRHQAGNAVVIPRILKSTWFAALYTASSLPYPEKEAKYEELTKMINHAFPNGSLPDSIPDGMRVAMQLLRQKDYARLESLLRVLKVSPIGTYDGINLDAGDVHPKNGHAMFSPLGNTSGSMEIDVTKSIPVQDTIEGIEFNGGIMVLMTLSQNRFWSKRVDAILRLESRQNGNACGFRAMLKSIAANCDEKIMRYQIHVPSWCLEDMLSDTATRNWDCYLELRENGISRRVKFGAHMSERCKDSLGERPFTVVDRGDSKLLFDRTPAGNIVFRRNTKSV